MRDPLPSRARSFGNGTCQVPASAENLVDPRTGRRDRYFDRFAILASAPSQSGSNGRPGVSRSIDSGA